jgi:ketosteroid isomerase-like protein
LRVYHDEYRALGEPAMSNSDFEDFLAQRSAAAEAYVSGDPEPLNRLVPDTGEGSFHSPSGDSVSGATLVAARYRRDAASFQPGGETRFDILQKGSSGDLGFWTGFQIATVRIAGQDDPVDMRIRVTEIFRRADGEWKMIHRHADVGQKDA